MQVEIKPYVLDEQPCDQCGAPLAAQFCAALDCLHYLCDGCWERVHSAGSGREQHRPLLKQTSEGSGSRAPGSGGRSSGGGAHAASGGSHRSKSGLNSAAGGSGCSAQPQQQHRGARSGGGHQSGRRARGLHTSQAPRLSGSGSGSGAHANGNGAARNLNLSLNVNLLGDSAVTTGCGLRGPVQVSTTNAMAMGAGVGLGDMCGSGNCNGSGSGRMSLFPQTTSQLQYY